MDLRGNKVIILGGSSGIGLATAKAVAEKGANVIIASSSQKKIDEALNKLPERVKGLTVDLSKEDQIRDFFNEAGNYDHLVYCAGETLTLNTIDATDIMQARDFFSVRFWGPFAAIKYGAPFLNKGGSVSLTSGTASMRPGAGWSVASSICGAIEGFVRAMAVELAPLRVNCVVPGVVKTPLWSGMEESEREKLYKHVEDSVLLKRVGEAEDIARGFIYLMEQDHSTGQSLLIDAGTVLI